MSDRSSDVEVRLTADECGAHAAVLEYAWSRAWEGGLPSPAERQRLLGPTPQAHHCCYGCGVRERLAAVLGPAAGDAVALVWQYVNRGVSLELLNVLCCDRQAGGPTW